MNKILKDYLNILESKKPKVKIPIHKGKLGLSLDSSSSAYKSKLRGGKSWSQMSKELVTLAIFNHKKHPEVAEKAKRLQKSLAAWVFKMRQKNPNFAK